MKSRVTNHVAAKQELSLTQKYTSTRPAQVLHVPRQHLQTEKCLSCKEITTTPINGAFCNMVVKDKNSEEDEIVIFTNQVKEFI